LSFGVSPRGSHPSHPARTGGVFHARAARAFRAAAWALGLALLAGCASVPLPPVAWPEVAAERQAAAQRQREVFERVWQLVANAHYDPRLGGLDWAAAAREFGPQAAAAPDEAAFYGVLNRMLAPLRDSHTQALPPGLATERRTQMRARTGFGLARIEDRWVVTEVLPGSPAERAGVQAGWIVERRNGAPITPRTSFRLAEGETVTMDFVDAADRAVRLEMTAERLSIGSRQVARVLDGGFVYLRFDSFGGTDRRWLSAQLKQHAAAPGVVIDLRRNPGGETISLGITIGEFFDSATDCGTFITRGGRRSVKNSWQLGSARYGGPVAVLVDGATGSAAEIFSAVLQDHGRATIVGRKTAGAVLASWYYSLPDGGQLQLSREDYLAPKGRRLEGAGVEPDAAVTPTLAAMRAGRDEDLERAVTILAGVARPAGAGTR
jgi:carboxyl-terminal processing protease